MRCRAASIIQETGADWRRFPAEIAYLLQEIAE